MSLLVNVVLINVKNYCGHILIPLHIYPITEIIMDLNADAL